MSDIVVTGASTGIGEACALRLDRLGHRVFAGVRREEDGTRLQEQTSGRLVPLQLDITDSAQIDAAVELITAEAGQLHGLVNNAGIGRGGPLEYLPLDEWREQFDVNVFGQVAVTKAMLPLLRIGTGRVVFVGSVSGKLATPMMGPYCASKFAIEAITQSLRYELRPWNLAVSVIEPGAVKTAIWAKGHTTADRLERDLPADAVHRYGHEIATLRKLFEQQDRAGVDPDLVAKAAEHALFARRPKTTYVVGTDARVQSALVRLLPDRTREAIVRRILGM